MKRDSEPRVRIAEFKARLSRYLATVRKGHSLTVLDRETPIARVVPYQAEGERLQIRKATREWKDVRLPPPLPVPVDSLKVLLEDREADRWPST